MSRSSAAVLALATLMLAGCAGPVPGTPGAAPAATSGTASGPGAEGSRAEAVAELRVGLIEWSVSVDAEVALAGEIAVHVTNAGASSHRLVVETADERWETPLLEPGAAHTLTIHAEAGETLRLGCDVRGHDAHAPRDLVRVVE